MRENEKITKIVKDPVLKEKPYKEYLRAALIREKIPLIRYKHILKGKKADYEKSVPLGS